MIKILHLTTDSKIAGAEKLLIGIAKEYDRSSLELFFCTLKPRGDLHRELEKLNQKTFSLNCVNITNIVSAEFKLAKILREHKIDILHTHLYHASVLGQLVTRLRPKVTGVVTRHYSDLFYIYGNAVQRFLDRSASKLSRHIIAISNGVKRVMVEMDKIDASKITVIYNGIDMAEFKEYRPCSAGFKKELGIDEGASLVGAIGNLHPRKGHRYLIEAADILCRKRDDLKFLIIGDGSLKKELNELRYAFDLENKIIFTGYWPKIMNVLYHMDIIVQPSVEEGFGLSIIEAMAMYKPVVATNVGGIPEIIEDKKTGMLVPSRNPVAIAEAVEYLLDNPDKRISIGYEARKTVEEKFNLANMVKSYERVYKNILA